MDQQKLFSKNKAQLPFLLLYLYKGLRNQELDLLKLKNRMIGRTENFVVLLSFQRSEGVVSYE